MTARREVGTPRTFARVLLVEVLDAMGSAAVDARTHADALERAGCNVRTITVDFRSELRPRSGADGGAGTALDLADGRASIRDETRRLAPDLILVASTAPGGGQIARGLPTGVPAKHWPTGFSGAPPSLFRRRSGLPALALPVSPPAEASSASALVWTAWDRAARRGRQSLWDGDYVLVPGALAGRTGSDALGVFAAAAATRDDLDLVVLGVADQAMKGRAEQLGIGTRVHFAGDAPREAERSWIAAASALLLAEDGPCSGGLVWRALIAGTPIVALDSGRSSREAARWLERQGCAATGGREPAGALQHALGRIPAVTAAIERGRSLAAEHTVEALSVRLQTALAAPAPARREAA
jgi:hypothetical protein